MNAYLNISHRRMGAFRQWLRLLLASVLLGSAAAPSAAGALGLPSGAGGVSLSQLRLPEGSQQAWLADQLWIHGLPARVLVFDAPVRVSALIRMLSAQQPALTNLNVLPGQVILSGEVEAEQWIAQLQSAGSDRSVGTISTLRLNPAAELPSPPWLPQGARLRLNLGFMEKGGKVSELIWQHALPPDRMMPLLHSALRREGWRFETESGTSQSWERAGQRMQISLMPLEEGSGLHVRRWAP